MKSQNLSYSSLLQVEELCTYAPDKADENQYVIYLVLWYVMKIPMIIIIISNFVILRAFG